MAMNSFPRFLNTIPTVIKVAVFPYNGNEHPLTVDQWVYGEVNTTKACEKVILIRRDMKSSSPFLNTTPTAIMKEAVTLQWYWCIAGTNNFFQSQNIYWHELRY